MKKYRLLLFVAAAGLMFASCSKEDIDDNIPGKGTGEIKFEIGFAPETRVATDAAFNSTWETGDEIGIFAVQHASGSPTALAASGNFIHNVKLTYNKTANTWTPATAIYYPAGGDQLDFYAYYPYDAAATDPTNITFNVLTDQTTAANLSKSDLLSATPKMDVARSANPVSLTFAHKLSLISLSVTKGGDGAIITDLVTVTLEGCKAGTTFNLSSGSVSAATGAAQSIKMRRVEQPADNNYYTTYTYRVLVPAQTAAASVELFRFSQGDVSIDRKLIHKPTASIDLVAGNVKPYGITLSTTLDPDHIYAVGDMYPHKGLPMGVVYIITNGGKDGKIVSLDHGVNLLWGPNVNESLEVTGIRSKDNGFIATQNLITVRSGDSNFATNYQAFNWIFQKNGKVQGLWYLPAANESNAFFNVWRVTANFNDKLTQAGGVGINTLIGVDEEYYRTSSEIDPIQVYSHYFGQELSAFDNKDLGAMVRGIRNF